MTRLRFPRSARLTRTTEFARVRAEGRSVHGRLMVCSVLAVEERERARVGIVTSRRVGSAVERNRVRRRLREIVRMDRPHLPMGRWIVLVARASAAGAEFAELQAEWRYLAKRHGLIALDAA
jgi:ribonuclease P protein component